MNFKDFKELRASQMICKRLIEGKYSLTALIRCSSRSVFANVADLGRKRRHYARCISKLSDVEAEAGEPVVCFEFASNREYREGQVSVEPRSLYAPIYAQVTTTIKQFWRLCEK